MVDCVDCTTNALTLFDDLLSVKNGKIWVKKGEKGEVRIHMVEKNKTYNECTVETDVENNDYPLFGKFTLNYRENAFVTIIFNCSDNNDDIAVNGYKVISLIRRFSTSQSKYLLKYDEKIKLGPNARNCEGNDSAPGWEVIETSSDSDSDYEDEYDSIKIKF